MATARDIPFDLVTDILSRVPANNLIRFKSVSNQWLSLIQDQGFAYLHLRRSKEQDARKLIKLWKFIDISKNGTYHTVICSINKYGIASPIHRKPYIHQTVKSSSCNGLLCYITPELNIQVSNPVTGETITLPKPSFLQIETVKRPRFAIGFDPRSKVYKIVTWYDSYDSDLGAEIFTLGTHSWRRLPGSSCLGSHRDLSYYCHRVVYVDGVSYWYRNVLRGHSEIISFDYEEEKFRIIKTPNDINASFDNLKTWFCESHGHLCIVEEKFGEEVIILWLLNKYGEWKDQAPINVPGDGVQFSSRIAPIRNGEIIICRNSNLDIYNEQGEVVHSVQLQRLQDSRYRCFDQFNHGSLVRMA